MNLSNIFVKIVNSSKLLTLTSVSFLMINCLAYEIFERKGFLDSIWWRLMTATTVGYGDMYPTSTAGRIIAIILSLGTIIFLVPMIAASISSKLIVNRDAFSHEEQEEIKNTLRNILIDAGILVSINDDSKETVYLINGERFITKKGKK